MKKLISFVMMLLVMAAVNPVELYAQGLPKDQVKQVKKQAKDLVKEGWKVQGSTTVEGKLLEIRQRENAGEIPLTGAAMDGYKKSNTALSHCKTNAVEEYVQMTGENSVKGRVTSAVSDLSEEEVDNLVDMAEQNFKETLKGELGLPVLKLIKQDPKTGLWAMQCWWLLSEKKIEQIRDQAAKQAISDAEGASKVGESISDFIKAGSDAK
ncbi:MAG: hypothetical protein K2H48_00630 [Duncaniella sp.]|nr:hypothetical protein [Duncaniella sp.]